MERGNISSFFCCFKTCVEEELVKYDYLEICTYSVCRIQYCGRLTIIICCLPSGNNRLNQRINYRNGKYHKE